MKWDYRVFAEENGEYIIREVFYEADGSILGCTENAIEPIGRSLAELARQIEWFKEALALPVLTLADVPCLPAAADREPKSAPNLSRAQILAELELA